MYLLPPRFGKWHQLDWERFQAPFARILRLGFAIGSSSERRPLA
jgi:hypothetical protein